MALEGIREYTRGAYEYRPRAEPEGGIHKHQGYSPYTL